jgi:hypothetical protein
MSYSNSALSHHALIVSGDCGDVHIMASPVLKALAVVATGSAAVLYRLLFERVMRRPKEIAIMMFRRVKPR